MKSEIENSTKGNKQTKNQINYSSEHKAYLKKTKRRKTLILSLQIGLLVAIIGLWELFAQVGLIDAFFTSSPSRMVETIIELANAGDLWIHIWTTLYEAILGFILATSIGVIVAILLWWSDLVRRVLEPYIVVLNSLPKIALGPLIIIWVGVGTKAIVVMAILITVVVTILSMLGAFLSCDKDKILVMQSMKASKFQIFRKLVMPNALPEFVSVLKINVGLTWVGTIMGEYLVSKAGLGYLIVYGSTVFKLDLVMASTLILCILASAMYLLVALLEKKVKTNH
ncbi:MAG: ABC transporter permease [Clostridia bacterium]|nr:ABC transporter permease [Clostridia bacterium]